MRPVRDRILVVPAEDWCVLHETRSSGIFETLMGGIAESSDDAAVDGEDAAVRVAK